MHNKHKTIFSVDFFFYLSMMLITFDLFRFDRYSLGSQKPLSLITLAIYVLFKFCSKRPRFNIRELQLLSLTFIILLISLSYGYFKYDDLSGVKRAIGTFGAYYLTYFGYNFFVKNADKHKLYKMLRMIDISFSISIAFGILQVIYIYIYKSHIIYNFMNFFLRNIDYLEIGKVQMNFSEPATVGTMVFILYPVILQKYHDLGIEINTKKKIKIILLVVLSLLSFSVTGFVSIVALAIGVTLYSNRKKKIKVLTIIGLCVVLTLGLLIMYSGYFSDVMASSSNRIIRVLADPNKIYQDQSMQQRLAVIYASILSFKNNLITGSGMGYFLYSMKETYTQMPQMLINHEYVRALQYSSFQSQSIFTIMLGEGGIFGLIWLYHFLNPIKNVSKGCKKFVFPLIIIALQNVFFYKIPLLIAFFLMMESKNKLMNSEMV